MKLYAKHKLINYLIFVLGSFLIECISFAFMGFGFFPKFFILDLFIFAALGLFIFLFKNTLFDLIFFTILLCFNTLVCLVNVNYYLATNTIFSLQNIGMIKTVSLEIFNNVKWYTIITEVTVLILILGGLFFYNIKFKINKDFKRKDLRVFGILAILFSILEYPVGLYIISSYDGSVNNNQTIDTVTLSSTYNMKRLGVFSYYIKEAKFLYGDSNTNIASVRQYFVNTKKEKNSYTGLLKDMNVITIMIETGDRYMVNEYTTPTLYRFLKDGVDCKYHYNKNLTGVSELIGLTGNYYSSGYKDYASIKTPFSLPNLLKDKYETIYCHDFGHRHDLYIREANMPSLGFKKTLYHYDLYKDKPEWEWRGYYYFDTDTMSRLLNNLGKLNDPFYLHFTSLTMHFPYFEGALNKQYFADIKAKYQDSLNYIKSNHLWDNPLENSKYSQYSDELDIYMMKCMDFDLALKQLEDYLIANNQLDNTLIVFYGDHDVYGDTKDGKYYMSELIRDKVGKRTHIDLFNLVLGFYNKKLNEKFHNDYKSNIYPYFNSIGSVVPTILDLLGIEYSPNMYNGKSLFSETYDKNTVMYSYGLASFMNKNYRSMSGSSITDIFDDNGTSKEFLDNCSELLKKQVNIDYLYKYNVFNNYPLSSFIPAQ